MSVNAEEELEDSTEKLPDHHKKLEYCLTRKEYRRGRRSTAVKVFTINSESKYIMVRNVHATGLQKELVKLFSKYGTVVQCEDLKDYPKEPFTQVFLLKFQDIQSARVAKRRTDEMYFFGSMLHVFYAPEYETPEDTRVKLTQRRATVVSRVRSLAKEAKSLKFKDSISKEETSTPGNERMHQQPQLNQESTRGNTAKGTFANLQSSVIQSNIIPGQSLQLPSVSLNLPIKTSSILQNRKDTQILTKTPAIVNQKPVTRALKQNTKPKFSRTSNYIPPQKAMPATPFITDSNVTPSGDQHKVDSPTSIEIEEPIMKNIAKAAEAPKLSSNGASLDASTKSLKRSAVVDRFLNHKIMKS